MFDDFEREAAARRKEADARRAEFQREYDRKEIAAIVGVILLVTLVIGVLYLLAKGRIL